MVTAVYDTIVRMAQDFSMRYTLVGRFGSVDGDSATAMRYTEIRMDRMAHELLADLEKETVDWVPNYDGTEQIPAVLPTKILTCWSTVLLVSQLVWRQTSRHTT